MINRILLIISLLFSLTYSQPLRKSVFSIAGGYIKGNNSLVNYKSSNQYLFWARYAFSSLDAVSVSYKKNNIQYTGFNYSENFLIAGAEVNFFPVYFIFDYGNARGEFSGNTDLPNFSGDIFSADLIYYNSLFFYSLNGKFIRTNWKTREKFYSVLPKLTWRPTKYFSASVFGQVSKSDSGTYYNSYGYSIFWNPLPIVSFSIKEYFGSRKYDFDSEYKVFYGIPFVEKNARIFYVRIFPWRTLSIILNYEHRNYETFAQEYYSASLRYDFIL